MTAFNMVGSQLKMLNMGWKKTHVKGGNIKGVYMVLKLSVEQRAEQEVGE